MAIIRLDNASLSHGDHALLDHVNFAIEHGEKIGLVGRNGMGKSTLMHVLAGNEKLDSGQVTVENEKLISYLPQDLPDADSTSVQQYLMAEFSGLTELLDKFENLSMSSSPEAVKQMAEIQEKIEIQNGWELQQRINKALSDLKLTGEELMSSLSGGWRRRVAIARSMLTNPDLLLLDEPTNHLDIPAIDWLESQVLRFEGAVVLITHDRRFLDAVVKKVIWLDRGNLVSFDGGFDYFIQKRDELLANEARQNALFDKRLAEEEKWIRQGIKARRTRNEGRVRALKKMRQERQARVDVRGNVKMELELSEKSGKKVIEANNIRFSYPGKQPVFAEKILIQRQDRIGIIGRNGAGKTTLLKLLLGELKPDQGEIIVGTKLEIGYFDQSREQLNENLSLMDNISGGRESIEINGKDKHVISYLSDFLFTPRRIMSPVSALSGGEKNRLLLAKIFSKPVNFLVLDEPTNDLDIETLELLEELIADFAGTVIVVSHDREFVDQIASSTLFIDDNGRVHQYVGGFNDLERQHGLLWPSDEKNVDLETHDKPLSTNQNNETTVPTQKKEKKLSYKLQRELDALPGIIEELENKAQELEAQISSPEFHQKPHHETSGIYNLLSDTQQKLDAAYTRWDELEAL